MARSDLRVMVTGSAGVLGRRLTPLLAGEYHVTAVIYRNSLQSEESPNLDIRKCDLTDIDATARLVDHTDPDIIINCAAMTDVDGCEDNPELAHRINCGIAENLLKTSDSKKTYFVQVSTDYLFDGKVGPYTEDAAPNPLNVYGRTKWEAEKIIRAWSGDSLIVRTSALYDCFALERANLFASIYARLKSGQIVKAASDLYCNPIWSQNLSMALKEAIKNRITGILNIAGREYLTRYRFACTIAEQFGFPSKIVREVPLSELNRRANRPCRAGVDITKASEILQTKLLSPSEAFAHPDFQPE